MSASAARENAILPNNGVFVAVYRIPSETLWFPSPEEADESGLLGIGGDLSAERLIAAYSMGIFPWYSDGPVLWWSPDPRCVLPLAAMHVSHRLQRSLRRKPFDFSLNKAFGEVVRACADSPRPGTTGTWLNQDMIEAYEGLHRLGFAHSIEVWQHDRLAGGIYGVALGRAFFGESMFYRVTDASKAALIILVEYLKKMDFTLFDCQQYTAHMHRFGAVEIARADFVRQLEEALR